MDMKRQTVRKSLLGVTFLLFQVRIFHLFLSPVLAVLAASQGIVNGSLILYGLLFASSLFLGRAWCGWLCPGAALQEICSLFVPRAPQHNRGYYVKYGIFSVWIGVIAVLAIQAGGFHSLDLLWGTQRGSPVQALFMLFGAFVLVVPLALLSGKWASCHYLCWLALFPILGTALKERAPWPSLHLTADADVCRRCSICSRQCPMGLEVATMVQRGDMRNPECILCGNCVDHCPVGAIRYAWERPKLQPPSKPPS